MGRRLLFSTLEVASVMESCTPPLQTELPPAQVVLRHRCHYRQRRSSGTAAAISARAVTTGLETTVRTLTARHGGILIHQLKISISKDFGSRNTTPPRWGRES